MKLTDRFESALRFAAKSHDGQLRKGSRTPYISHPMAVAALVMEYGGTEDQVIGALLHDVMEDCGVTFARIERSYGTKVARIVEDCSDCHAAPGSAKPPWAERKRAYLSHLAKASRASLLVSAADKLHNARSIVHDVMHFGPGVWKRFRASPGEMLWYYSSLVAAFDARARSDFRRGPAAAKFRSLLVELRQATVALEQLIAD
jgi:(p)ppGpp synthase/HD superfamily hydrolase